MCMRMLLPGFPGCVGFNHVKMRHHARRMVFKNMAMVHPSPGAVIRHPRDLYLAFGFKIVGILPCLVSRRLAILFYHLEKESMQMKRMVHKAGVCYFPNLQFAYGYRFILAMHFSIYQEINAAAHAWPN